MNNQNYLCVAIDDSKQVHLGIISSSSIHEYKDIKFMLATEQELSKLKNCCKDETEKLYLSEAIFSSRDEALATAFLLQKNERRFRTGNKLTILYSIGSFRTGDYYCFLISEEGKIEVKKEYPSSKTICEFRLGEYLNIKANFLVELDTDIAKILLEESEHLYTLLLKT